MAREKICCIYKIISTIHPDRLYIGSTLDFHDRKRRHRGQFKNKNHHNIKLQSHVNKYGIDDLTFSIIERIEFTTKEHLIGREQYYIDTLKPYLNINIIADSSIGVKRSEETRRKIGEASKGRPMPAHVLEMLIKINTGSHISEEHKKAVSKAQSIPKPWMSERNKGNTYGRANKGKPNPFKGKKKKPTGVVPRSAFPKGHVPWNKGKKIGKQDPAIIAKRVATMKKKKEDREKNTH